jgi:hypothetical protein
MISGGTLSRGLRVFRIGPDSLGRSKFGILCRFASQNAEEKHLKEKNQNRFTAMQGLSG